MCQPSHKIKLCTCKIKGKLPENYWVLYRFSPGKQIEMIGDVILPNIDWQKHELNEKTIMGWLNAENCFDKEMELKEKDALEIHLNKAIAELPFLFQYTKRHWSSLSSADPFILENKYRKLKSGEIELNLKIIL